MHSQDSTMLAQDAYEVDAPRPFGPGPLRLVHAEKRGPAFSREFLPVTIADQLGASLVAQTAVALGELMNAFHRGVFLDVMPAWTRLLAVMQVRVPKAKLHTRTMDFWREAPRDVAIALCHAEDGQLSYWMTADFQMRQFARECAERSREKLRHPAELGIEGTEQAMRSLCAYEAFAEGRSL